MNWESLLCLGDSITYGARSYLGYPEYTGNLLSEALSKHWNVINHANNGSTAADLSRSVSNNFMNLKGFAPGVSTILIGTNDAKAGTPVEDFEIALRQIVIKSIHLTANSNVILFELPHFREGIMYPYQLSMNASIDGLNAAIRSVAADFKIRTFSFETAPDQFYDGVHLTDVGSKAWATQLSSFILSDRGL
jgi:lysophospholipase L1-like esterase